MIILQQDAAHYKGRSANLWFGRFLGSEYRWWEIPYFQWNGQRGQYEPFGVSHLREVQDADYAASPASHTVQHAAQPKPIDGEYTEDFIERWVKKFADASMKRLQRPGNLPE